ncbi:MAG: IS481 family transposase [Novosphingobium sp.]|nr:IS481 family transposase [Novosphingobium sp.]
MDAAKARLAWIELYIQTGNACLVCRRCGISRPTLRKWWQRYQADGVDGLAERSRRPHRFAGQKVFEEQEGLILGLRRDRELGIKQLRNELIRQHELSLSLDTIHKVLVRHDEQVLKRPRRPVKGKRRYSRPVPGDRVQMDVCKICPGVYQYTAIDDCSRYKVLGVYSRRTAASTLQFLQRVIEEMPFPIQRIQTDRGLEFFAENVQRMLKAWAIKFRPIPPRSPHLNGKVERTQRTDLEEFWSSIDPKSADVGIRLEEWQFHWNWHRTHTGIGGLTPIDRICDLSEKTPFSEEVEAQFQDAKERIRHHDYKVDQAFAALK